MLTQLKTKIRSLVEDFLKTETKVFVYSNSNIFNMPEDNTESIVQVLKNGNDLGSATYDYNSDTNQIVITDSLSEGDLISVKYTYYKYSNTEILGYIRSALVWISIYGDCEDDFELDEDGTYVNPTPENKELDLIAIIASIIVNPNHSSYKLPNITVTYPKKVSKIEMIEQLINKFYRGLGVIEIIERT